MWIYQLLFKADSILCAKLYDVLITKKLILRRKDASNEDV